jgi:hypothetical protein
MRFPATRDRLKSRVGLGLAARSCGENSPWHDAVEHLSAARWRLASSKVLPVSTRGVGGALGRGWAWSWGTTLTKKGSSMMRRLGGGKRRLSVVARELRWLPAVPEGCCSTGERREVRWGSRLIAGGLGGWSSPRWDEVVVVALNSPPTGVLRLSEWGEKEMGMQEGSRTANSMWREREGEWKRSSCTRWCRLPFKPTEN